MMNKKTKLLLSVILFTLVEVSLIFFARYLYDQYQCPICDPSINGKECAFAAFCGFDLKILFIYILSLSILPICYLVYILNLFKKFR